MGSGQVVAAAVLVAGAGLAAGAGSVASQTRPIDPEAYLATALELIQANALDRETIDWPGVRARAVAFAAGAKTPAETYPAIRGALRELNDRHSFLQPPDAVAEWRTKPPPPETRPEVAALGDGLARVTMRMVVTGDPDAANRYATELQDRIAAVDREGGGTCGWIVDLRENGGGNMWPMLAGLGPVLGEGTVGAFAVGETRQPWSYAAGAASVGPRPVSRAERPYRLRRGDAAVATITGPQTASSGEAVAVAFRRRPQARSFGAPTAGLSTANRPLALPDGAQLFLTVSRFADRAGRVYGRELPPDEPVPAGQDALAAAAAWLRTQPACSTSK